MAKTELTPTSFGDDRTPIGGDGAWYVTVGGKRIIPGKALKLLHGVAGWSPMPNEFARLAPRTVPVARTDDREAAAELAQLLDDAGGGGDVVAVGDEECTVVLAGPLSQRQLEKALKHLRWVPGLEEGADLDADFPVSDVPIADDYDRLLADTIVSVLRAYRCDADVLAPDDEVWDDDEQDRPDDADDPYDEGAEVAGERVDDREHTPDGELGAAPFEVGAMPVGPEALRRGPGEPLVDYLDRLVRTRRDGEIDDDQLTALLRDTTS